MIHNQFKRICFINCLLIFLHLGEINTLKGEEPSTDIEKSNGKSRDKTKQEDFNFWKGDIPIETKVPLYLHSIFEDVKKIRSSIAVENDLHFPYEEIFFSKKKTADVHSKPADKINDNKINNLLNNVEEESSDENSTYIETYYKAISLLNSFYSNKREAYALLLRASRMGSKEAKAEAASELIYGTHLQQNITMAKEMFEQMAEDGVPEGHTGLGFLHSVGLSVNTSQSRALLHYTIGAMGGSHLSRMKLGFRYWLGISVSSNCEKALEFYSLVASHVASQVKANGGNVFHRVRLLDEAEDPDYQTGLLDKDLLDYYQMLANNGDVAAQVGLGHMYYRGSRGLPKDYKKAMMYFQNAAIKGNAVAMAYVGKIYLEGDSDLKVDFLSAYVNFKKSADQGNAIGQYGLGLMYLEGKFVVKSTKIALIYLSRSADQGWVESLITLGTMYLEGKELRKDQRLARRYFIMASQVGHVLGFFNLGKMYANGFGVMRSCATAVELFKNVAERGKWGTHFMEAYKHYKKKRYNEAFVIYAHLAEMGYEVAQNNAAYLLDRGLFSLTGEDEDRIFYRAQIYWRRSALQGNPSALLKLGDYNFYGLGTLTDYEAATSYYRFASEQYRNPQALFNLGYMYEQGLGVRQDFHLAKRYYEMAADASPDAELPVFLVLAKLYLVSTLGRIRKLDWAKILALHSVSSYLGQYWDLYLGFGLLFWAAYIIHFRVNRRDLLRDIMNYL